MGFLPSVGIDLYSIFKEAASLPYLKKLSDRKQTTGSL
jgi:hypothetical protein